MFYRKILLNVLFIGYYYYFITNDRYIKEILRDPRTINRQVSSRS